LRNIEGWSGLFFEKPAEFWTSKIELISPSPLGKGWVRLEQVAWGKYRDRLVFQSSRLENLTSAALIAKPSFDIFWL
jgi:hypothetical protein